MGDSGNYRFPGCLDPRAEEFRPAFTYNNNSGFAYHPHTQTLPQFQPPQFFLTYPTPPPPPPIQFAPISPPVQAAPPPPPTPCPVEDTAATRTILLSSVPRGVSESEVRRELEVFGDVRAVEMERLRREGIVTVHFYDLRHAIQAAHEVREQHMQHQRLVESQLGGRNWGSSFMPPVRGRICGHVVWAQFVVPNMGGVPDGYNQGTLVVFHLDPKFSSNSLKQVFEPFGAVKDVRETPLRRHQRFVEFYDVRDAASAYSHLNGKEILGNQISVEFSRPGGYKKHIHNNNISRNPNFRPHNPPHCSPLIRQDSNSSQARKSSSQGSSNGSDKSFQKHKSKKDKQESSGSRKAGGKNKAWSFKGRHPRSLDPRFLINEEGIVDSGVSDLRTTVMVKNIPNKYSQKLLMNMLDNHCIHCNEELATSGNEDPLSSYDFVYLPIDFVNKCNVGYGFVNMTSPVAALRLYKAFHRQTWEVYNSKKICEVTYARLQGLEALKEHFRTSKFPCAAEEYLPVVFSPPRDGRLLTEPNPIAGRATTPRSLSSSDNNNIEDTSYSHQTLTDDDCNIYNDGANDDDSSGGSSQ